jgi:hypothetical protein
MNKKYKMEEKNKSEAKTRKIKRNLTGKLNGDEVKLPES